MFIVDFFLFLIDCTRSELWQADPSVFIAHGVQFRDQGLNPGPLHRACGVLATGPPGKAPVLSVFFFNSSF